uniref:Bromo domain-containing protein n=1 Tax=Sinocyclocheilus grahami TaxID=75366 RepID=A0A672K7G1_SINGR
MCVYIQMKRKELTRRDDEDGDSMLSSTLSDGGSTKRKRYIYSISKTTGLERIIVLNIHAVTADSCPNVSPLAREMDKRGRRLSTIFLRLPSRAELPDYYVAIKKPIDMEKVKSHMLANKYQDVDALVEDLVLMFNNACTYNEPESLIYKDALVLHKVLLETRRDLEGGDDAHVPDVARLIQELIRNLFVSVLGHQDDEGRCYKKLPKEYEEDKLKREEEKKGTVPVVFNPVFKSVYLLKTNKHAKTTYIKLQLIQKWTLV